MVDTPWFAGFGILQMFLADSFLFGTDFFATHLGCRFGCCKIPIKCGKLSSFMGEPLRASVLCRTSTSSLALDK
jgi:hypothetical protein